MARFARPVLAVVPLAVGLAGTGCSSGGLGTGSGGNGLETALGRVSDTVGNRNPDKPRSARDCPPVTGRGLLCSRVLNWLASATPGAGGPTDPNSRSGYAGSALSIVVARGEASRTI